MKRSHIALLVVCLVLVPLTLFLGVKLPGVSYYVTGTALILELMVPFFMAFEGRKVQARELVVLAVMCALAIAGRVVIPVPYVKAAFAIIMITGIAFGPESGFLVGAVTAFASNFVYGQGPFTPWQMMAYGLAGMLAGFLFCTGKVAKKPWIMAVFGFFTVLVLVGPLMDLSGITFMIAGLTWANLRALLLAGLAVNLVQAATTAAILLLLGKPLLEKLQRVQLKFGITDQP